MDGCGISLRPPEADGRAVPGHREGDLVLGGDLRSCLVTLVERKTRFLVCGRLDLHDTETVVGLVAGLASSVPASLRSALLRTLTWDQGSEMAGAARLTLETGVKVYFCTRPGRRAPTRTRTASSGSTSPRGPTSRGSRTPR